MGRPNVVIFYTDDQGTMDAGCYGSVDLKTPHMDGLAGRGIRFTQAYAHTVCCPSRSALLTGRFPQRSGINDWASNHVSDEKGINMFLDEVTIAQILKAEGYRTALFGKWHVGAKLEHGPNAFGFDEFFGHRCGFIDNYKHMFLHSNRGQPPFHDLWRDLEEVFEDGVYFSDLVVREAHRFLDEAGDDPFFLYLPFNLPHYPYQPDGKFVDDYKDLPEPRSLYAPMVATVDDRIGQVIQKIDDLGMRDNTLIIYMSDNGHSVETFQSWGMEYGAHGGGGNTGRWRGHKGTFYEGGIRVPAIVSFPGHIPQGEVRDQAMTNMDFLTTILEMLGIEVPDCEIDGK
ncbi:MAG: sulfatase-like hydrolase/transferase, partial [Candidatus Latescibacteria bacterium]|nr:sulfatase-like hydrolase/transferase [Candidatus Latescibacterota bacterium]